MNGAEPVDRVPSSLLEIQVPEGQEPDWLRLIKAADLHRQLGSAPSGDPQLLPGAQDTVDLVADLKRRYPPQAVASESLPSVLLWHTIGLCYWYLDQLPDALGVFLGLYEQMLAAQQVVGKRVHKGLPLVRLHDCFFRMGFRAHRQRYAMLTLCEDAISAATDPRADVRGSRWRLLRREGLAAAEYDRYLGEAKKIACSGDARVWFPEWVLQQLDELWMRGPAVAEESQAYWCNGVYIDHLLGEPPGPFGDALEFLAEYVLSCMAGCRTMRHRLTYSSDLDVICSLEIPHIDYRSELGHYFIAECKGREKRLSKRTSFTEFAKFCRVLDSMKCRLGVLFTPQGISRGSEKGHTRYASREQLKVYQDRGIVVVVVDREDIKRIAEGGNFVTLLREKYETVRLDLWGNTLRKEAAK